CIEREVTVRCEGRELKATAFTTRPERSSEEGPISVRFVQALVRGAKSAGLPDAYIERIRAAELA
ncbi:MAG TPA: gamma-glutamylcyclotransferase, partial [Myxococcaceae bacterium]|nr:gamma-glutamylcyclotransferase [Myxococcaceae bacterium]